MKTLDVSGSKGMWWLNCSNNKLTSLKIGRKTDKNDGFNLKCSDNQLTQLDLSKVYSLDIGTPDLKNNKLKKLYLPGYYADRDFAKYLYQYYPNIKIFYGN